VVHFESSSNEELRGIVASLFRRFLKRADTEDEDSGLGPKHPAFAAHFRDPVYDDEGNDLAPFGNDEGWDLLVGWVKRAGELDSGSTLAQIASEWFEDVPAPDDLNEDDVDLNDIVIGAGFTLLRLTGQIGEADRALVLRALDIRDRTHGQHPETQQMRTDLLAFGQST
jgi:uncharacterized protein YfeS